MGCSTSSKHGSLQEDHAFDLKPVISRSSKLSRIVADLLKCVFPGIRKGLADLDTCLHHALLGLRILEAALVCFEEEDCKKKTSDYRRNKKRKKPRNGKNAYGLTLGNLSEFKLQAGAPFIHLDVEELQSALEKLEGMMDALRGRKKEIEETAVDQLVAEGVEPRLHGGLHWGAGVLDRASRVGGSTGGYHRCDRQRYCHEGCGAVDQLRLGREKEGTRRRGGGSEDDARRRVLAARAGKHSIDSAQVKERL
ncbi:unnamed protein product [Musa acuminata subsp. burmannicoides]